MESEKAQQLQFFQQNLQTILMQKQAFQMELNETLATLEEIEKSPEEPYKLLGKILVKMSKKEVEEELHKKKKILETRLNKLEENEEKFNNEIKKIRDELLKENPKTE